RLVTTVVSFSGWHHLYQNTSAAIARLRNNGARQKRTPILSACATDCLRAPPPCGTRPDALAADVLGGPAPPQQAEQQQGGDHHQRHHQEIVVVGDDQRL